MQFYNLFKFLILTHKLLFYNYQTYTYMFFNINQSLNNTIICKVIYAPIEVDTIKKIDNHKSNHL